MKAQVLLPKVFNFPFTYYNNQTSLRTGDFVEVPFGKNKEIGVVWTGKVSDLKNIKIKNINKKINDLSINKKLIDFIEWFAAYNMMPLGLVLKMSIFNNLNSIEKKDKDFDQSTKKIKKYSLNDEQKKAYEFLDYKNDKFVVSVLQGTTGSGKTLTSFKTAQILMKLPKVEKVVFVVDRQDLDDQTVREFRAFDKDSIDGTDNTNMLIQQFLDDDHLIAIFSSDVLTFLSEGFERVGSAITLW